MKRGDRNALRATVEALIEQPARRKELGDSCRSRVMEMFSEDGVIERLRSVYREVEEGRRP